MQKAKSLSIICLVFMLMGCSEPAPDPGEEGRVPLTNISKPMVGVWGLDGQAGLVISSSGDELIISTPLVEGLRVDISEARLEGDVIYFVQKNYFLEMETHPFNGVAHHSSIQLIDSNTLEYAVKTIHTPEQIKGVLTRIE